jgi:endonuclease/exonuclease/phosphatase family metal-dependent hydrolase
MIFRKYRILFLLSFVHIATAIEVSLVSWNILGPESMDHDQHFPGTEYFRRGFWKSRKEKIQSTIKKFTPDILCLQEVSSQMVDDSSFQHSYPLRLTNNREKLYALASVQNKGNSGGSVILYDPSKITLLESERCSLSNGSYDKAGAVAWAIFDPVKRSRLTKKENLLIVGSVHFSRANDRSQSLQGQNQVKSMLDCLENFLKNFGIDPNKNAIVIAGDFNTFYEEVANDFMKMPEIEKLQFKMLQHKMFTVSRRYKNQNQFGSIDHILYSPLVKLKSGLIIENYQDKPVVTAQDFVTNSDLNLFTQDGPSDHLPVGMCFELKEESLDEQVINQAKMSTTKVEDNPDFEDAIQRWIDDIETWRPKVQEFVRKGYCAWDAILVLLNLDPQVKQYIRSDRARSCRIRVYINNIVAEELKKIELEQQQTISSQLYSAQQIKQLRK